MKNLINKAFEPFNEQLNVANDELEQIAILCYESNHCDYCGDKLEPLEGDVCKRCLDDAFVL